MSELSSSGSATADLSAGPTMRTAGRSTARGSSTVGANGSRSRPEQNGLRGSGCNVRPRIRIGFARPAIPQKRGDVGRAPDNLTSGGECTSRMGEGGVVYRDHSVRVRAKGRLLIATGA
jgi:hypothetical protein